MKKPVAMTLALLLCSFIFAFTAGAVDAPHYDPASGSVCGTCHTVQLTLGSTGYNNICQNCHRPGDPAAGRKPITLADAANPFGLHSTTGISKMYQTSHRWDGADVNPAAGAQAPVLGQMTTNGLRSRTVNQLACVRCHNQHDNSNGSFLRVKNDKDQLCMDCHRSRNVQSHTQGSHPVNISYPEKYAANPNGFNAKPLNLNSTNPTSNLFTRISSAQGSVLCSTCHSAHFADSRSSTVDGSANFANLSSGDGYLLRTDRRGADPGARNDSANICSTCHAGKKSHNMKGQDVQCTDCHGAHVEYDPDDPTGSKGTNIYLVRRNAVTKDGRAIVNNKVFFRYTGSNKEYTNSTGTGVCQSCHSVPAPDSVVGYPPEHSSNDPRVCNTCHFHNSTNGSFSGACTACHGYPPTTANGLIGYARPTDPATGATPDNPGAHETHATGRHMACITCHTGYAAKQMPSNTIDIGFSINNGTYKKFVGATSGGTFNGTTLNAGYAWSPAPGTSLTTGNAAITCSVYCHGTTLAGGTATPPTWTKTDGSQKACGACHGVDPGTAPTTGSHTRHAKDNVIACALCHGAHNNNDHVNGSVEWDFSASGNGKYKNAVSGATGNIAPSSSYGTCSNMACHSSGQSVDGMVSPLTYGLPAWGGTLTCGDCHKNMKTDTTAPGGHVKHAQKANFACATCHNGYTETSVRTSTHTNGMINLSFSGAAANATYSQYSTHPLGNGYGSCSNVSCHTSPYGTTPVTTPKWGAAACSGCHNSAVGAVVAFGAYSVPATGSHVKHLAIAGALCSQCHNGAVAGSSGGTGHLDGNIDVTGGYPADVTKHAAGSYSGTCSTAACHADPYSALAATSPVWGTVAGCAACHNGTGAFGTNGAPATGSHNKHMSASTSCSDCHDGAVAGTSVGAAHANGKVDVTNSYTAAPVTKHAAGSYTGTCSTTCHSSTTAPVPTPTWGATATCASCHDSSPATGSHGLHLGFTVSAACIDCHTGAIKDSNSGASHLNGKIDVTNGYPANVVKHAAGSGYSSCSTASCHASPYGSVLVTTPVWGVEAGSHCAGCHNGAGAFSGAGSSPATGSHNSHMAISGSSCAQCHTNASASSYVDTNHKDGDIDVANGYPANVTKHTAGTYSGTCSNASCHVSPVATALIVTPVWGSTGNGCTACHAGANTITANGPATGSHTTVAGHAVACSTCHAAGTTATTVPGTGHADGDIDVVNVGYLTLNKAKGTAGVTCSSAACHVSPVSTTLIVTPAWGSTGNGCAACHAGANAITATGPATGSHTTVAGHAVSCGTCHAAGTTATTAPGTGHADGDVDVVNVGYLTLNKTKGTAGVTCSNTSCHVSPVSTTLIVTPAWGSTGNGCAACHAGVNAITATGPATGSHTTVAGHAVACSTCHTAGTTATTAPGTGHADGNIDVANVGYLTLNKVKGTAGVTCSSAACHVSPVSTTLIVTPAWGSTGNGCAVCHAGANAITATGPATGSHTTVAGHAVACSTCHATGTTATTAPNTGHADGNIDVANVGYLTLNKAKGTAGTSCSATVCHGTSSPAWGTVVAGVTCTKCHGKPTLTNYSTTNAWQAAPGYAQAAGSGTYTDNVSNTAPYGAHDAHVRAINQYTTRKTLCFDCHGTLPTSSTHADGLTMAFSDLAKNIGTSGGNATTGPSKRGTLTPGYAAGTCSAVYCHGGVMAGTDTTPEWRFTGTSYLTPYAKNVTNCGKCHAALPVVAAKDHSTMTFATQACTGCHGHEGNGQNHIDGILQASGACNSCHGYQAGSWAGAPSINPEGKGAHEAHIVWLTTKRFTTITLTPATDSYAAATTAWNNVCGICHGSTPGNHSNGTVNISLSATYQFGSALPAYKGTPGVSSATLGSEKTCSNISCHYFTTPLWSTY